MATSQSLRDKPTRRGIRPGLQQFHQRAAIREAGKVDAVPINKSRGTEYVGNLSINGVSRPRDNGPIYQLPEQNDMGMLVDDPRTCHEADDEIIDTHELLKKNMQFYSGQDSTNEGRGYKTGYIPNEIQEESRRNRPRAFPDVNLEYGFQDNYLSLDSRNRSFENSSLGNGRLVFPVYDESDTNQPGRIGTVSPLYNIIEVQTDRIRAPAFAIPGERVYIGIDELQNQSMKLSGGQSAHFVFEAVEVPALGPTSTGTGLSAVPNAIELLPLLGGRYIFRKPMRLDRITLTFIVDGKPIILRDDKFQGVITQSGALANATQWLAPVLVKTVAALPTYIQTGAGVGATLTATTAGVLAVDGVILAQGDRILVDQIGAAAPSDPGIYVFTNATNNVTDVWVLTRATDFDETVEVLEGSAVRITSGARMANTSQQLVTADPITVDTTALTFQSYSSDVIITTASPHNLEVGDQIILNNQEVIKTPSSSTAATDLVSSQDLALLAARRGYLVTSIPSPTQFTIPVNLTENAAFPIEQPTFFGKVNDLNAFATNVGAPPGKTIIQTERSHGFGGLATGQSALFILRDWFSGDPATDAHLNIIVNLTTVDIPAPNQITIPEVPTARARLQYDVCVFNRHIVVPLKFRSVVQETTNYISAV